MRNFLKKYYDTDCLEIHSSDENEKIVLDVITLANNYYDAGYHQVIWNANNHSSGLYILKMVSGDFIKTQKLMLVK